MIVRLSEGVEWGLHCVVLAAMLPDDAALPAGRLGEYHDVPTAYLAKHLQALSRAGILEALPGPRGGYRLARPAADITVLDVVEALDGREPAFRCTEIRRRGPTAMPARTYTKPCGIHAAFMRADDAWRGELANTTIADVMMGLLRDVAPAALEKGARWLGEAVR